MSDIAEEALREQIKPLIERAVLAGNPEDTDIQTAERAVRLALATDPNSKAMSHAVRILTAQRFYVERVESVRLEEHTKRGIVRFVSPVTAKSKKGWDELRTDPLWTEEGRQMFDRMKASIGHGGMVFKQVEDAGVFPEDTKLRDADGNSLAGQIRKSKVIVYFIDQGEQDGAVPERVDEPTARVAHEKPYDPAPKVETLTAPRVKPTPMREEDRQAQAAADAAMGSPEPAEPVGEDWKRDETVAPTGSPTEQRNKILELAQHIGRADARDRASAAVGYDVSALIVPELRSAADAAKVIVALQNAWNEIQVQRKQAAS
jgi:hypothetical protein